MSNKLLRICAALFALLLIANIAGGVYLFNVLTAQPKALHVKEETREQRGSQLVLSSDVISKYLRQESSDDMSMTLTGQQILIKQQGKFLGRTIRTNILTTPVVIGHNKLKLKIDDVSVANLPLSKQQTLKVIDTFGNLPDNVQLDVKNEVFYYDMQPIKLDQNKLDLTKIDADGWHFNLELEDW